MGERQADKIEALQARVAELEGRVRERSEWGRAALDLLREIQWAGTTQDEPCCPSCDENAPHALVPGSGQHAPDCKLAALLPEDNFPWAVAPPADVPPVLGSPADIWIPNTETTTPPVLVAGDVLDDDEAPTP